MRSENFDVAISDNDDIKKERISKFSIIAERLTGQPMFNIMAQANEIERKTKKRIIHFEIGDPNFSSPKSAIVAASLALKNGKTHYTDSMGIRGLRDLIREIVNESIGFKPSLEQVLIAPANAVIDFLIRCVANLEDEIIIPDPGFPTYFSVANYNGIKSIGIPLREENCFKMKPEDIELAITSKTRLIIVNSPNNPTGSVMQKSELIKIAQIAQRNNLFLLLDEVYSKLIYAGNYFSPSIIDKCKENILVLGSMSKAYAMAGWRIGYVIGPEALIAKMGLLLQTIVSCLPAFIQLGAKSALEESNDFVIEKRNILKQRRDILVEGLNKLPGVSCIKPRGAFYAFANIKNSGMSSKQFSEEMLKADVCLLPGDYFGDFGKGYVRLSYGSVSINDIRLALDKMYNCLKRRKK